jgi:hypothetical protein
MKSCRNRSVGQASLNHVFKVDPAMRLHFTAGMLQLSGIDDKSKFHGSVCRLDKLSPDGTTPAGTRDPLECQISPVKDGKERICRTEESSPECGPHQVASQNRLPYSNHSKLKFSIYLGDADSLKQERRPEIHPPAHSAGGGLFIDQWDSSSSSKPRARSATIKHEMSEGLTPAIR